MSVEIASSSVAPLESRTTRILSLAISALSILGMLDSGYLTIQHMRSMIVPCGVGECQKVLTSIYSEIHGIPTSMFGFGFYATVFLLLGWDTPRWWIAALAGTAFIIHMFLVYLQAFVLHAFCIYCLFSAGLTTLLLLVSIFYLRTSLPASKGVIVEPPAMDASNEP